MMQGGGGGGVGGGLNRGAGPGMLANVADVDGAVYNPRVTRRALAYVLPHRWGVAFALAMTVAQAARAKRSARQPGHDQLGRPAAGRASR